MTKFIKYLAFCFFIFLTSSDIFASEYLSLITNQKNTKIILSQNENNQNKCLVSQEQTISLQKGENTICFNFQNVNLNIDFISLKLLEKIDDVEIISMQNEQNIISWKINSQKPKSVKTSLTYQIFGLNWNYEYRANVDASSKKIDLKKYLVISNNSNLDFENAQIFTPQKTSFNQNINANEVIKTKVADIKNINSQKFLQFKYSSFVEEINSLDIVYKINSPQNLEDGKIRFYQEKDNQSVFLGENILNNYSLKNGFKIGKFTDIKISVKEIQAQKQNVIKLKTLEKYDISSDIYFKIENFSKDSQNIKFIFSPNKTQVKILSAKFENSSNHVQYKKTGINTFKFDILSKALGKENLSIKYISLNNF